MHLYIIPRGVRHAIQLFETYIQAQMFSWKRINLESGKEEISFVAMGYRDCGMFKELVFPREHLLDVLKMLDYDPKYGGKLSDWKKSLMRLGLGNKVISIKTAINKWKDKQSNIRFGYANTKTNAFKDYRYIEKRGVDIAFIGIKEDEYMDFQEWGYKQEAL